MLLRFFRGNAPGTERTRRPLLRRNILKRKRYLASDYLFMSPSTGAQRRGCKFPAAFSLSLTRRVIPGDYFQTSTFQTAAHRRNSRFGRRRRGTEEEYKGRWVRDHFLSKEAIKFVIRTGARLTSFVPRQNSEGLRTFRNLPSDRKFFHQFRIEPFVFVIQRRRRLWLPIMVAVNARMTSG